MANLMDYLDWRGDLDFMASPFGEVDNIILSELIYVDFEGIVPPKGQGEVTLKRASEMFFAKHTEEEILAKVSGTKMAAFMMQRMAKTKRFGEVRLGNYTNEVSTDEQSQFCAMTVQLMDGAFCIVYSGTDSTMVGWRENFNMSFWPETPGQLKAVRYLKEVAENNHFPLRVMGHSKGGNLAVYASTHVDRVLMERIQVVYSNDGPGFSESVISEEQYRFMLPKIHTIIPESSIVGMLLEHEEEFEVVKSTNSGARQHDVMSWEVLGPSLVHIKSVDEKAILVNRTLKSWMDKMDNRQRQEFVETLFGILEEAKIETVDDLANILPSQLLEIVRLSSSVRRESQELMRDMARALLEEGSKALKNILFHHSSKEDDV